MASSINAITTGSGGVVTTADNSGDLNIQSGGSTKIAVTSAGVAVTGTLSASTTGQVGTTLGVGNATPSASGAGITFPATQSASTDANTLDDYEEGTWTPTLTGFTTVGGNTGLTGSYTKIGKLVYLQATITYATSIAGVGGTSLITGLPFSPSTASANGGFSNDGTGVPINVISAYPSGVRIYFPTFSAVPGIDLGITYQTA